MPAEVLELFQVESFEDLDDFDLALLQVPEKRDAPPSSEFESSKFSSSFRSFGNFLGDVLTKIDVAKKALRHIKTELTDTQS